MKDLLHLLILTAMILIGRADLSPFGNPAYAEESALILSEPVPAGESAVPLEGEVVSSGETETPATEGSMNSMENSPVTPDGITWLSDYNEAWSQASREKKMLLIFFYDATPGSFSLEWEQKYLKAPEIQSCLAPYVLLRLPYDAKVQLIDSRSGADDRRNQYFPLQPINMVIQTSVKTLELPVYMVERSLEKFRNRDFRIESPIPPSWRNTGAGKVAVPQENQNQPVTAREVVLLKEKEFAEMLDQCGISIIDLKNVNAPYYGDVVSVFPFLKTVSYGAYELKTMLTLPSATLTQRTMIYAVRVHPERPRSTEGLMHPALASGTESHSNYQARIRLQGHHNWDQRAAMLSRQLPAGHWPSEVCAEGWSWQNLLEAAIDCVKCWRQSSGHWSAVSAYQTYYGYDIKKGSNGVWYGTGLFGQYIQADRSEQLAIAESRKLNGWSDANQLYPADLSGTSKNQDGVQANNQGQPETRTVSRPIPGQNTGNGTGTVTEPDGIPPTDVSENAGQADMIPELKIPTEEAKESQVSADRSEKANLSEKTSAPATNAPTTRMTTGQPYQRTRPGGLFGRRQRR